MFQKELEQGETSSSVPGTGSSTNKTESCDELAEMSVDWLPPGVDSTQENSRELEFLLPPNLTAMDHDYCSQSPSPFSRPSSSFSMALSVSLPDLSEDALLSDISSGLLSPTSSAVSSSPCPSTPCQSQPPDLHVEHKNGEESVGTITSMLQVRDQLILMLPAWCVPMVDNSAVHVLMVGRRETKSVQRQISVSPAGAVRVQVHGEDYPSNSIISGVPCQKQLCQENFGYFVDRMVQIVSNVRLLEVCAGMDHSEFKEAWVQCSQGIAEGDTFKETRYKETFRSKKCLLLVPSQHWRCKECSKLKPFLRRKLSAMHEESTSKYTNTRYLVDKQKDYRLASKQKLIKNQQQTIDRLQSKMIQLIEEHGVKIEKNLSDDLKEILKSANLSPTHFLFLQQQLKAIHCKKSCGMRWHPTLIRMALSIYLKAPGAYKELSESGFVKLPTSRTLFDYSHVTKVEPGIDKTVLKTVVKQALSDKHNHPQYHVVMADEMHISKNLVTLKSTGELIGFKDLDDLDQEVASLEAFLDDSDKVLEPELATKVMAFMVKGVSSKLKHVVASFPVCNPSPKQMYKWTWDVIGALERSGVKVIAFICDGCPSNRAFIKLHTPATIVPSGVVFDTVNKFAPDRLIYFFSDVPHLLKTARNAFFNSRRNTKNKKKSTRLLKKNKQVIVWDTIIRLYLAKKDKTLRKSYKLNAQNVFPDSYSRMKVKPAAEVLSHTVGTDVLSQGWQGTSETVDFIFKFNNWFDLLNGAYSTHGKKKNNKRLDPYTMKDLEEYQNGCEGSRFQELLDFLKYLDDWKAEVQARKNASLSVSLMSAMDDMGVQPLEDGSFHELNDSNMEDDEDQGSSINLMPHQTLLSIEMSTRAFIAATTFLLREGVSFINARVFCQDPLEQNFGRQRMAGGGSNNPNFYQYLHKQRGFSMIGELSATNIRGNTLKQ